MSNELIWLIFAIVNFGLIVLCYYLFGKIGLFAWIAMATVLANIQVMKTIELFGVTATLGNIMYGTVFLAGDVFNEKYGSSTARKAVFIGFFINLSSVIIMQIALMFQATSDTAYMNDNLTAIFKVMPIIFIASLIAYLVSQLIDIAIFQKIKKHWPEDKMLWARKTGSTLIGQAIDTLIFVTIAFGLNGTFKGIVFWEVMITTYVIKAIVALLDTPFIYLMQKIQPLSEKRR